MAQRIKTKQEVLREFPDKIETLTMPTREYVEVFPYFGMSLEKAMSEDDKRIESGEIGWVIHSCLVADENYIMPESQGINGIRDDVHERSKQAGNWASPNLAIMQIEGIKCLSVTTPENIKRAAQIILDIAGRYDVDLSNIQEF